MVKERQQYPELEAELKRQGRKYTWVAERLGVSKSMFSNYLSGFHGMKFTDEQKRKLAEFLRVDIEEIF